MQQPPDLSIPKPENCHLHDIHLPHKRSAPISTTFIQGSSTHLVVFLNGLGLPQVSWYPAISHFQTSHPTDPPSFLTYDRFGQGLSTSPDPQDEGKEVGHGHDVTSVIYDLHLLIIKVCSEYLHTPISELKQLVFVANSIGCAVARYYAQIFPSYVTGLILLDSYIANTDFVSVYPDPDDPGYKEEELPPGITTQDIRIIRKGMGMVFHPSVANKEGFSRRNMPSILPESDGPVLVGRKGKGPLVTVVGHDFETFAEETTKMPGVKKEMAVYYFNPFWHKYNEGLVQIGGPGRGKGPIQAERAGHFIQKDRPDLVATELKEILDRLEQESS